MAEGRLQTLDDLRALPQEVLVAKLLESQAKVKKLEALAKNLKIAKQPEIDLKRQDTNENFIEASPNPASNGLELQQEFEPIEIEASDSLPLVQSPYVTTPPYEYIVLTKENERKLRIFYNSKVENIFQHQVKLLKGQGQGQGQEGHQSQASSGSSSKEKHHHHHCKASIAGTPTPSFILEEEDEPLVIQCFDDSKVDLEIKKVLKERPPTTHKFVRRKSRVERGSSVPAIDSYYGTEDLEKVGHASYFIPELTEAERKAIGWKDTYSYGKWKYSGESGSSVKSIYSALRKSKSGNKGKSGASKKSSIDIILASDKEHFEFRNSRSVSRLAKLIFGRKSQNEGNEERSPIGMDEDSNHATIGSSSTSELRVKVNEGQSQRSSEMSSSFIELAGDGGWKFKKGKKRLKSWMTHLVPCYKVKKEKRKFLTFTANLDSECGLKPETKKKKKGSSAFKYFSRRKSERSSKDTSVIGGDVVVSEDSASFLVAVAGNCRKSLQDSANGQKPIRCMKDVQISCTSLQLIDASATAASSTSKKPEKPVKVELELVTQNQGNEDLISSGNDNDKNDNDKAAGECPSSSNSVNANNNSVSVLNDLGDCEDDNDNDNDEDYEDEDEEDDYNAKEDYSFRPGKAVKDEYDFPETRFLDLKDLKHPRYASKVKGAYDDYEYENEYEDWDDEDDYGDEEDEYGEDEDYWGDYDYDENGNGNGAGSGSGQGSGPGPGQVSSPPPEKKIKPPPLGQSCKIRKKPTPTETVITDCKVT